MNKNKKIISIFLISLFLCGSFFVFNNFILANNNVDHIVISEIQIGGESVYDEFIELYNPTDANVNLENWDLKKKTKSGTESNILNNIGGIIPTGGYFLIAPRANCGDNNNEKCYTGTVIADDEYTTNNFLAADNTVLLYDNNENIIDKVGWGEVSDFEGEAVNFNPENNQSLERIKIDNLIQDMDNNKNDFTLRANPNPQNSNDGGVEQGGFNQENGANEDNDDATPRPNPLPQREGNYDSNDNQDETNSDNNDKIPLAPFVKGGIIITEFLPNPEGSDKDNEFIEIYNKSGKTIDLGGWILEDKIGAIKKFIISDGIKISSGKYEVFYSDETKITLNNSGDGIILRDNNNNIINETQISDSSSEGQSFALNESENWVWTLKPTPGRKNIIETEKDNEIKNENNKNGEQDISTNNNDDIDETPPDLFAKEEIDFSDRIIISEIYPNPKGRDNRNNNYEFIEIYNNSTREVNLNGWLIDDVLEKGSKPYLIKNETIKAGEFKVFSATDTKIALNNAGDEVNLLWPDGTVVDKIKYEKADEGLSYNLSNNENWIWSSIITPAGKNRIFISIENEEAESGVRANVTYAAMEYSNKEESSDENDFYENENKKEYSLDYMETNIENIKHFTKYAQVKTIGVVSTPPGIFADNVLYLSGSGIQIYSYEAEIPALNVGDEVEIIGRVSEVGGEKRILLDKSEDIKIISRGNLVEPKVIFTGEVNEDVEGYLVTIEGKVTQKKDDVFFLDDGSGEVKVYVKPQTKIKKPDIKIGDWMTITGQVSQISAGYRVLPRFSGDLKTSKTRGLFAKVEDALSGQEVDNKNDNFIFYAIIIIAAAVIIFVYWAKVKIKNKKDKHYEKTI